MARRRKAGKGAAQYGGRHSGRRGRIKRFQGRGEHVVKGLGATPHAADILEFDPAAVEAAKERDSFVIGDSKNTDTASIYREDIKPKSFMFHGAFPENDKNSQEQFERFALQKFERHEKLKHLHIIENLEDMEESDDKVYHAALDRVRMRAPLAKRFVFDDEASMRLGEFIRDRQDIWFNHRQFALPPYPVTYIQLNIDNVLKAIGAGTTADISLEAKRYRDMEAAYLIDDNMIYPMARGSRGSYAPRHDSSVKGGISLFRYEIKKSRVCTCRPIFFGEPLYPDDKFDHVARAMLLLGSSYNNMVEDYVPFLHDYVIHLNLDKDRHEALGRKKREENFKLIFSSAGDFRVILAALMLLNQQKHITTVHVPNNSMLIGGKRKVIQQHHRVVIRVQNFDVIKRELGHKLMTPRCEHEVRGHWRNVHVLKGCEHEWKDLSDAHGIVRWSCGKCNGLRTTVRPHKRGDPTVGKSTKDYEVKE
jgi:hypothetical protein